MLRRSLPLLLALACTGDEPTDPTDTDVGAPDPYDVVVGPYDVSIRTTSYGIPHITAEDEGSLGHGLGHIWARNHICVLADQLLKVRSERSKYFGDAYIDGDFGWKHLRVRQQAEAEWFNLTPELRARIVGVAAGYNAHLAEVGVDGLPEPCQGADWVKPIDHIDLRVEWFPSAEEVVSASVFTKKFNAPIETIVIASAQQSVTWQNAEGAFNRGIEFEYRKQLLPVLFTSGNVSLIESNVDIGRQDTAVQTSTERALQGQSPYVINLQLAYDDDARGSFDEHHSRLSVPSQVFFENNDENEWKMHIALKGED